MVLQIEEPGSALDIGKGFRSRHLLLFKNLARTERPFELADELFKVVLDNAIQGHKVAIDVVQDLNRCRLGTLEIEGRTTSELFNVAFV